MFQYCKITHLEFFFHANVGWIFLKNVASENFSHLSESRAGQNAGFLSKKSPKITLHRSKRKRKQKESKLKQREMKEKKVVVALVFFVFVFCCCFCFVVVVVVIFHCLYFGDGFHHNQPTMIRTLFEGKVRLVFLKFGFWKSVVI